MQQHGQGLSPPMKRYKRLVKTVVQEYYGDVNIYPQSSKCCMRPSQKVFSEIV